MLILEASLHYCGGDKDFASFLSKLIYWCDKGGRKDGYIFKTYPEWRQELGISRRCVVESTRKLEDAGLIETCLKKSVGFPTKHYRLNQELLS